MSEWVSIKEKLPESKNIFDKVKVQINVRRRNCVLGLDCKDNFVIVADFDVNQKIFIAKDNDLYFNPLVTYKTPDNPRGVYTEVTHWAYLNDPVEVKNNK